MTDEERMALVIARGYMRGLVSREHLDAIRMGRQAAPERSARDVIEASGVIPAGTLVGLLAEVDGERSVAAGSRPFDMAVTAPMVGDPGGEDARSGVAASRMREAWPERVGDYLVTGQIGAGGMGIVLAAVHDTLHRTVAIKLIRADWAENQQAAVRFEREVRAVGQLQHENIVRILEVGNHEGAPFFVMELLPGQGLDQLQRQGRMVPERAARLCLGIARGLAHAHSRGVIHRDVKPSNVLVTPGEDGERPVLIDFGLARQVDSQTLTMTQEVLGTPVYMSPEQAVGRTRQIGPLSDVYSLGATLYELLTGSTVHQGGSPLELMHKIRTQDPTPPRDLRPELPLDLEVIALKCLEKEPRRRYASASAVARDLQAFLDGEPIGARPVGAVGRALRTARRYRAVTSVAMLALVLLGALGTWSIVNKLRDIEALDLAREEEQQAKLRAQARAEAQDQVLQALRLVEIGTDAAQVLVAFDHAESTDTSYHGVFQQRGRYLLGLGRTGEAITQLEAAISRKRDDALSLFYLHRAFEREGRSEAERWELLSQLRHLPGGGELTLWADGLAVFEEAMRSLDPDRRRQLLTDARHSFDQMIQLAPRLADGYLGRGRALSALGEPRLAREDANRTRELAPEDSRAHLLSARVYAVFEMHDEAIAACDRALYLAPDLLAAYETRAEIELDRGWMRHAREDIRRATGEGYGSARALALALAIEDAAGEEPERAASMVEAGLRAHGGDAHFLERAVISDAQRGRVAESRELAARLCEVAPRWPRSWRALAISRRARGDMSPDVPGAVAAIDRALELTADWRGLGDREGSWTESLCLVTRAELASQQGDDALAADLCKRAHRVGYHPNDHHYLEARIHAAAGRCDQALQELERMARSPSRRIGFWMASGLVAETCSGTEAAIAMFARGVAGCPGAGSLRAELSRLAPRHELLAEPARSLDDLLAAARAALDAGERDRAAELAESALTRVPESAAVHLLVSEIAWRRGDVAASREACGRALARDPYLVAAYERRAQARWHLGDREDALVDLDHALALQWTADLLNQRALMQKRLGRWQRALADYDAGIELDPDEPRLYQNRANALVNLGEHERALASYDRSLELDPERWRARLGRGLCHYGLENFAEAEADIQAFLDEFPDYPQRADLERTLDDIRRKLSQLGE